MPLLVWAAVLAATMTGTLPQSGHDLYQQALVKERAEGNLPEAIDLYERIARDFHDDHPLAAKALVQMGQCYEKLGKAEARKAYERVVRDYADQAEALEVARSRLAALSREKTKTLTVRRLEEPPADAPMGAPSPDGRSLSYVDWRTGNLMARDLETGVEQELCRLPTLERGIRMALSPDGRWLSFINAGWGGVRALRVIPAAGGEARTVWSFGETKPGTPGGSHVWSPDGRHILFSAPDPDDLPGWVLWRVPAGGGTPERMGLERRWGIFSLTVHPSGRRIAFAGRGGASTDSEVWVMERFLPPRAAPR